MNCNEETEVRKQKRKESFKLVMNALFEDFGVVPIVIALFFFSAISSGLFLYWLMDSVLDVDILINGIALNSFGRFWSYVLVSMWGCIAFYLGCLLLLFSFEWSKRFWNKDFDAYNKLKVQYNELYNKYSRLNEDYIILKERRG